MRASSSENHSVRETGIRGFPVCLIDALRCNNDAGRLHLETSDRDAHSVMEAKVRCEGCGAIYHIRDGIFEMFESNAPLDERSRFELNVRDREAGQTGDRDLRFETFSDRMEVPSTLERLGDTRGRALLEIGCGTGRYTRPLAKACGALLAVDFSRASLLVNAKLLPADGNVGLVWADVSKLKLQEAYFDLALSTLYSNLSSPEIRSRSTASVFHALKPQGRYVVSAHHLSVLERKKGTSASGEYDNGIFYQNFTKSALRQELEKHFSKITIKTICIWVPYISRSKASRVFISRFSERLPILNQLGDLLLATAVKDKSSF